ncbi:MAG: FAD-binding protein, partial [Alphaproteobacteria bacterium]|nr:FAD-binding protein [Alphaproteobacteria bacterium]
VARGGYYNKGEGIRMAMAIGAAPAGDFGSYHAEPIDPRSAVSEAVVAVFNYGILVNRDGRRFVDEAPATVDATYDPITREIWAQPGGIAYCVLDAGIDDVPNWRKGLKTDQPPVEAATLDALAGKLGIDAETFVATVAAYNAACRPGTFTPLRVDGLATAGGLRPRKSNWARPLAKPPFRAWPIMSANVFTYGGLRTDTNGRVVNADGEPIPGLYAAGEITGLYYGVYTGATSVLRGAVFGRRAGLHAATYRRANV